MARWDLLDGRISELAVGLQQDGTEASTGKHQEVARQAFEENVVLCLVAGAILDDEPLQLCQGVMRFYSHSGTSVHLCSTGPL